MDSDETLTSARLRTGGDDAVAFTSGPQGAPFSAGVVHAWLAADRERPLVATGISMGTFAAVAMRRVYEELEHADNDDLEVKRWRWYQRYYQSVTDNPLGPMWNAVPDPVDFFSSTAPAKDLSVPASLRQDCENARRHYFLLTKSGVWLANLPVRVSTIATLIVMYVRRTEGYGVRLLTWLSFYWSLVLAVVGVLFHLIRSPQWISESEFDSSPRRRGVRPLLGWTLYLLAIVLPLGPVAITVLIVWVLYWCFTLAGLPSWLRCLLVLISLGAGFILVDQSGVQPAYFVGQTEAIRGCERTFMVGEEGLSPHLQQFRYYEGPTASLRDQASHL